jgi:hypothetical protein
MEQFASIWARLATYIDRKEIYGVWETIISVLLAKICDIFLDFFWNIYGIIQHLYKKYCK